MGLKRPPGFPALLFARISLHPRLLRQISTNPLCEDVWVLFLFFFGLKGPSVLIASNATCWIINVHDRVAFHVALHYESAILLSA